MPPDSGSPFRQPTAQLPPGLEPAGDFAPALDTPPEIPGYQILGELGRGGMGVVYKAKQIALNRIVALKMMLAGEHTAPANLVRFLAEAESVAQLSHPNIVRIYEIGRLGRLPFLALEYVGGGTLATRLRAGPLSPSEAATLIETLAQAIQHAHRHGVIHRDLKPANILLGEDGTPRIADFGLAKRHAAGEGITETGAILGTPSYMAPEQANASSSVTTLSDVYALGAILYECLTGRPPFEAPTVMNTVLQVLGEEPVPPRHLQPKLPRDLETICLKCLHKDPKRRYGSAQELADDLRRFRQGQAVHARPVSRLERAGRWCRRNPAAALAIGLAGVVLAALLVVPVVIAVRENQNAKAIEQERQKALAALRESRRQAAVATLERALVLCESGEVPRGLLHLARGQELAQQAEEPALERVFRLNIATWLREVHALTAVLPHPQAVAGVSMSPDGQLLATACDDGKLRLWQIDSGQLLFDPIPHPERILAVAVAPDGRTVATGCVDGIARQWNTATGKPIGPEMVHYVAKGPAKEWPYHHGVYSVAYSPDGSLIATGAYDGTVRLWNASTGISSLKPLPHSPPQNAVRAVAFTPDGSSLASGGVDWNARIWEVKTGKLLLTIPHRMMVLTLAFSPEGKQLSTGSGQGMAVHQWDAKTGRPSAAPLKHLAAVKSIAYDPAGHYLLSGSDDQTAQLWDPVKGTRIGPPLQHRGEVLGVAVNKDGKIFATAGGDGEVKVWRKARGMLLHSNHSRGWVRSTAFTPDSRCFLSGNTVGETQLFDVGTGKPVGPPLSHPRKTANWVTGVAVPSGGQSVFAADCQGQVVRQFDRVSHKELGCTGRHGDEIWGMALSPDGRTLLTGAMGYKPAPAGSSARLWDAETGKPIGRVMEHDKAVYAVAFRPDGKAVLTGSLDRTTRLWDSATGEPLAGPHTHSGEIWTVSFRPDGKAVLVGGGDRNAQIFDPNTSEAIGAPMQHQGGIWTVGFSPDGQFALTGSADQTARIWDAETSHPIGPPLRHTNSVRTLSVSQNGRFVVTGGDDFFAKLWAMPSIGPEDPEQSTLWIESLSGLSMDERGKIRVLSPQEWRERVARRQGSNPAEVGLP